MLTLVVMMILSMVFVALAVRNWDREIGAGPTILIVGAIFVSAFGSVKYSDYQTNLRQFDVCVGRVERSIDNNRFNETLVNIIEREVSDSEVIVKELRDAMLPPLELSSCGPQPTFVTEFKRL